jgi:hypothetical protein
MFEHVNELSVLVSGVLSVAVGSIWYSPLLFGKPWMRGAGLSLADENMSTKETMILTVKAVIIQSFFYFIVAQFVFLGQAEAIPLATVGAFLAALLVSYMMGIVVWEKKSLTYLLVHAGYGILVLFGGIGVIAFWPW